MKNIIISWNTCNVKNWIFPILVNKEALIKNLELNLLNINSEITKKSLKKALNASNTENLREYSKKVFIAINNWRFINDISLQNEMRLFQTAFLEMELLFSNIDRKQEWKNWFDHILGVLNELLETPNINIKHILVALLHDWPEEFREYSFEHIKKTYWENISKSVKNMTKENPYYYLDKWLEKENYKINNLDLKKIMTQTKQNEYYGNIPKWWKVEIWVKYADRIDSLKTIEWTWDSFLKKKALWNRKIFFKKRIKITNISSFV